jgi:hypothetical protein
MSFDRQNLVREYSAWVQRQTGGKRNYSPAEINQIAQMLGQTATDADCRKLGRRLSYLANWYAREGVANLSSSNAGAWAELLKGAQFEFWNIRIRCRSYDRLPNKFRADELSAPIIDAGQCGILCMALGAWTEADWMAHRLQQSRTDGSISPWTWYHAVPRLVIALQRLLAGQRDVSDLELGVYRNIFAQWDNQANLRQALLDAANYHVENLRDKSNADIAEFTHPPMDIVPAELIAIQRVREKLGLETPAIDHPLMETPFANPPSNLRPEPDELLSQVLDKVRTIIPDL